MAPTIFSCLVVDLQDEATVSILSDVASGKSTIGAYYTSLEIRSTSSVSFSLWPRVFWGTAHPEEHLIAAIPKFISLKSFSYVYSDSIQMWFVASHCQTHSHRISMRTISTISISSQDAILRRVAALPRLAHLSIDMGESTSALLHITSHFKDLQSLHFPSVPDARLFHTLVTLSPKFNSLTIDGASATSDRDNLKGPTSLSELLLLIPTVHLERLCVPGNIFDAIYMARRHFASLAELTIHSGGPAVPAEFWSMLKADRVQIRCLTVHQGDDALYEYLQSYSGLVALNIDLRKSEKRDADLMAGIFWLCVLPKHARNLRSLSIQAPVEGDYCLTNSTVDVLLTCTKLATLSVCVGILEAQVGFGSNVVVRDSFRCLRP